MIDFHTHILHRMDDGPETIEKSVRMLEEAYEKGTDVVVLSSHFYPKDERALNRYLDRRNRRFLQLSEACEGKKIPYLCLAAEANIHIDFADFKRMEELCLTGTEYMLIEMPRSPWTEEMYESIYKLTIRGIKPIIAHVDRYLHSSAYNVSQLSEFDPVYQANSELFLTHKGRKIALELFNKNRLHIIGSDMHSLDSRKNTLPEAYIYLENNFGEDYIKYVEENGAAILNNNSIIKRKKFSKPIKRKLFI